MRSFISQIVITTIFSFLLAATNAASAADRVALVIGNSAYEHTEPLKNAKNDAQDIAAKLRGIGFKVIEATDLAKPAMDQAIKSFAEALEHSKVSIFFYAGHGLQVNGANYLVPVDAKLTTAVALEFETVRMDLIQRTMERLTETNILIVDACRNNPLSRSLARAMGTRSMQIRRGLARQESGVGTLIAYSTQPDNVALDGEVRNSPFAKAMLKFIDAKGEDISSILISIRNDVMRKTQNKQIPWEHSSLSERFYFVPPMPVIPSDAPIPSPATVTRLSDDPRLELELWGAVKDSQSIPMLQAYLQRFPQGTFSGLGALRIAALEIKPPTLVRPEYPKPAVTPAPTRSVIRQTQKELKRVGCYAGPVDGEWGDLGKKALLKFADLKGLSQIFSEPGQAAVDALKIEKVRVCPLECEEGTKADNGKCVAERPQNNAPAVAAKPPARSKSKSKVVERQRRQAVRKAPEKKKWELCFGTRNEVVNCDDGGVMFRIK